MNRNYHVFGHILEAYRFFAIITLLAFSFQKANAEVVKVGDIYYNIWVENYEGYCSVVNENKTNAPEAGSYSGNVTIPSSISYNEMSYKVVEVGISAFANSTNLNSIMLPEGLQYIGDDAFKNCSSLTEITWPSSVNNIGAYIFDGCDALENVFVKSGNPEFSDVEGTLYQIIGSQRFLYFIPNKKETCVIPSNGILNIMTWKNKPNLKKFEVSLDNPRYCDVDGILYTKDKEVLFACPEGYIFNGDYYIPEDVTIILSAAFAGCMNLGVLHIPSSVTEIMGDALANNGLTDIYLYSETPPSFDVNSGSHGIAMGITEQATLHVLEGSKEAYLQDPVWNVFSHIETFKIHSHTFASEWTQTATHHYHACTGENCDIADYSTLTGADASSVGYGEHSYGSTITEISYYTCSVCEYVNTTRKAEYDAAAQLAADKTTFSTYKTAQKTAAEALGMSGDSDACKVLISTATTAIEALTYDESKTLAENKVAADAIVTQLTFDLATQRDADNAAGQLSSDKTAFNTYKTAQKTAAEALGKSGDSDACKALISAATAAIEALAYDESKTLAENKAAADAIVNKLGTDLDAKRAAEKAEKDKEDADQAEADRIAADKKAVEDYKSEQKKAADGLAKAGDTAACQKLIVDAKAAIDAVAYDKDKSVATIKTSIDEIVTKLKKDLEAAREANGLDTLFAGLQIKVSGSELCIEGAQGVVVNIYTMGGALVASKPASEEAITVTLPASTYIIKAGNQNCKIQIK